ncbi:MAG: winged helix-turn-helix transcriptional regulator [Gammaproteobacteria bacterium]|nr:winged helix-turn-helix transcriptional regulator [Gammaproteobacteria bacterium]
MSVRRTSRLLGVIYDAEFAPLGLKSTQFSLLVALSLMDGAGIQSLATAMQMDRTTLTRNLRPLQSREWVAVGVGDDRRSKALHLTPKGRALLTAAMPAWERAQQRVERVLGVEGVRQLNETLRRLEVLVG